MSNERLRGASLQQMQYQGSFDQVQQSLSQTRPRDYTIRHGPQNPVLALTSTFRTRKLAAIKYRHIVNRTAENEATVDHEATTHEMGVGDSSVNVNEKSPFVSINKSLFA